MSLIESRPVQALAWIAFTVAILRLTGVNPASALALGPAAAIAIGLTFQDLAKSFVAGRYIRTERPFTVGQQITVSDKTGIVIREPGLRFTTIRDGRKTYLIPNTILMSEIVEIDPVK